MGRSLLYDVIDKPVTSFLIAVCSAVWTYIHVKGLGYADVGSNYDFVMLEGQYWRLVTAPFSHISFLHLVFNMSALWTLGSVEGLQLLGLGVQFYVHNTLVLLVFSSLVVLGCYHILIHRFKLEFYRRVVTVGYSCVVFGWMTILSVKHPSSKLELFGLLSLPISFAPFESLVFTSIIVPQASFLGHLSGIFVGYLIAWNVLGGMNNYWAITLVFWTALLCVLSLKRTSTFDLPFLEIEQSADQTTIQTMSPAANNISETEGISGGNFV